MRKSEKFSNSMVVLGPKDTLDLWESEIIGLRELNLTHAKDLLNLKVKRGWLAGFDDESACMIFISEEPSADNCVVPFTREEFEEDTDFQKFLAMMVAGSEE